MPEKDRGDGQKPLAEEQLSLFYNTVEASEGEVDIQRDGISSNRATSEIFSSSSYISPRLSRSYKELIIDLINNNNNNTHNPNVPKEMID